MSNLPTNYVDDVLNTEVNTRRRFNMINNGDGTVSFEDVTDYTQEGSPFGASDVNLANTAINNLKNKYDFLTGGFLLEHVPVNLASQTYSYSDARITADSLAMVFFENAVADAVYSANVTANTTSGAIVFTSQNPSNTTLYCDIYVIAEDTEE